MAKPSTVASIAGPIADSDRIPLSVNGGPWTDATLDGLAFRTGGSSNTTPIDWTGYHRYAGNGGGLITGLWTAAMGVGALAAKFNCLSGVTTPQITTRLTSGDLSAGNAETWGGVFVNNVTGVTAPPTDAVSPFNALEVGVVSDPAANGGGAHTIPETRGMDSDMHVSSGTVTAVNGVTARVRHKSGATVSEYTGFSSVGPNSLVPADVAGTLSKYVGFHAGFDGRGAGPDPSIGAYTGLQIDPPDTNHPVSGAAIAVDIPGDDFGISLGSSIKQTISCLGATGQLNVAGKFVQSGAFDSGNAIAIVAEQTTIAGAFYGAPAIAYDATYNSSNSPNSQIIGVAFSNTISGSGNAALARVGAQVAVSNASSVTQHVKALNITNADVSTTNNYKYGLFVSLQTASAAIDNAAIGLNGTGLQNGIAFDAKDGASSASAGAYIHWDGTDLLCTVGGTSYIINSGTTKP